MRSIIGENLVKKVIVRFRPKAGKNGQVFPQRSWMSGLMIISSRRLILASGPFHFMVPYEDLLSIEDKGSFPLPDGGKGRIIPLVHSSEIDAFLTMVAVTPSVKAKMVRDIYENICCCFNGFELTENGSKYPVYVKTLEDGIAYQNIDGDGIILGRSSLEGMIIERSETGYVFNFEHSGKDISITSPPTSGRWMEMLRDHYLGSGERLVEEKQKDVLNYLSAHPSTTGAIGTNLSMVALEASTVLNEMVFLGWVALDHYSKMFQITEEGRTVLSSCS